MSAGFRYACSLPPGRPSTDVLRNLLTAVFEDFRWVEPRIIGSAFSHEAKSGATIDDCLDYLSSRKELFVKGGNGSILLLFDGDSRKTSTGRFCWFPRSKRVVSENEKSGLEEKLALVASILSSPIGQISLESVENKARYKMVLSETGGTRQVPRNRGYCDGLLTLYWKNVFGPIFSSPMLEGLKKLEGSHSRDLGNGYWSVTPYEKPEDGLTPDGEAKERELIEVLGSDLFYDFENEQIATRIPEEARKLKILEE